jgi:hypothetical protein
LKGEGSVSGGEREGGKKGKEGEKGRSPQSEKGKKESKREPGSLRSKTKEGKLGRDFPNKLHRQREGERRKGVQLVLKLPAGSLLPIGSLRGRSARCSLTPNC